MKIGIIGGNSFIGSHLIRGLSSLNNVSFKIWSRIGNKAQKPNSEHFMYNFPNSLFQIEDILDCEAIFYCTGSGIQPGQKFTTNELYQLNLFEPIRLINGLQEKHYKGKIITFGSYFEIGTNSNPIDFNETQILESNSKSLNEYSVTKKLLTNFVDLKIRSEPRLQLSHFIVPNIYGELENSQRLIPYLVQQIITDNSIEVGLGTQVRQYLYIEDITEFFKEMIPNRRQLIGIYNLNGCESKSIKQIVDITLEYGRKHGLSLTEVKYNKVQKQDAAALYLGLNGQKARLSLGWNPTTNIINILPKYFNRIHEK